MFNKKRFWAVCAVLAAAGIVLTTAGIAAGGIVNGIHLDSRGLHVVSPKILGGSTDAIYSEKGRRLESFSSIELDLCQADVRIEASDSGDYEILYNLVGDAGTDFICEVTDNRLVVAQKDRIKFLNMDFSWFSMGRTYADTQEYYVTIRVPAEQKLSLVDLKTESGDFICRDILADRLDISAEYGDISLQSLQAQNVNAALECGQMLMEQVSGDSCSIKNEYGDIQLKDTVLAQDLKVIIEAGNMEFQNASLRDLDLQSSYGNIDAARSGFRNVQMHIETGDCRLSDIEMEKCIIKEEYGDVSLSLPKEAAEYGYKLKTEYGGITINGEGMGESFSTLDRAGQPMIQIECETGDIVIQ